jgi:hypothetical protein
MSCITYRAEIEDADFDARLGAEVEEHLHGCARCRDFYHKRAALRRLVSGLERVSAPADFDFRLRARLAAAKGAQSRRFFQKSFAPSALSIALAACFALTIGLALRSKRVPLTSTSVTQTEDATRINSIPNFEPQREETGPTPSLTAAAIMTDRLPERSKAASGLRRHVLTPRMSGIDSPEAEATNSTRQPDDTIEASVRPAPAPLLVDTRPLVALPVSTSPQLLKVVLRDERGAASIVSIEPVSFGAQELIGRVNGASRTSLPTSEGVW